MGRYLSAADISASGLAAERLRMEVVANNIANAHTTRTQDGGPYRRKQVLFAPGFASHLESSLHGPHPQAGVHIVGIEEDESPFAEIYDPHHPHRDERGIVKMPNVHLANEMVDMMTASRAYEANLQALQTLRSLMDETIALLQSV